MPELNRTLIVRFDSGLIKRISFPEKWTFTFSGFIPKMNERGYGVSRPSLRIYGPRKTQMACFTDVSDVRDTRVNVEVLDKTELDDLYWKPQEELDLAPTLKDGKVIAVPPKDYPEDDSEYAVEVSFGGVLSE